MTERHTYPTVEQAPEVPVAYSPPARQGTPAWAILLIVLGAIFGAVLLAAAAVTVVLAAAGDDVPAAAPTPAASADGQQISVKDDPGYTLTQTWMDDALRRSGSPVSSLCTVWTINPDKWVGQFTDVTVAKAHVDRNVATAAVEGWFKDKC